jgi:tRNA G10  N-methylase Trm11
VDSLPPLASFLLFALQRAARGFAGVKETSNPTWVRPKKHPPRHEPMELATAWLRMVRSMARDLESAASKHHGLGSEVRLGDSRELRLPASSVDLVVTSPPYCTRIDYAISTSFELATLGIGEQGERFDDLRRGSMGTPLVRPTVPSAATGFPEGVTTVLRAIQEHPSKSSKSYYYKTYAQYFADAIASLDELQRVLKSGASAVLVVQTSYYKDIYIDLPDLYLQMARATGMEASIAAEFNVTRFLAQINTRSTAHRSSTTPRESVLILEAA